MAPHSFGRPASRGSHEAKSAGGSWSEEAEDEDGEYTIPVRDHKTGGTYGIAHMPILNPVLLKLLRLYLTHVLQYEDMSEEEQKSTPVFQSKNKEPLQILGLWLIG